MLLGYWSRWPANSTSIFGCLSTQPEPREVRISTSPTFLGVEQRNLDTEIRTSRSTKNFYLYVAYRARCTYRTTKQLHAYLSWPYQYQSHSFRIRTSIIHVSLLWQHQSLSFHHYKQCLSISDFCLSLKQETLKYQDLFSISNFPHRHSYLSWSYQHQILSFPYKKQCHSYLFRPYHNL